MYVAMTRAIERLLITFRKRQMGQPVTVVSSFLGEIVEKRSEDARLAPRQENNRITKPMIAGSPF
jgi:superfamily I DNA/RNA helicase